MPTIASVPAIAGPLSVPRLPATLTSTIRRTDEPGPRTTWVMLLVQKIAREPPCSSWAATKTGNVVETMSRANVPASPIADTAMSDRSANRPSSHGRVRRTPSCVAAATATSAPTVAGA